MVGDVSSFRKNPSDREQDLLEGMALRAGVRVYSSGVGGVGKIRDVTYLSTEGRAKDGVVADYNDNKDLVSLDVDVGDVGGDDVVDESTGG